MSLRTNITWLLEHYGLSQNQLAQLTGVTQSRLNRALNTTAQPRLDMIRKIADPFGIPVGVLVAGEVSKQKGLPDRGAVQHMLVERQIDEMRNVPPGLRKLMVPPEGDDSRLGDLAINLGLHSPQDAPEPPPFPQQLVRDGVKASNGGLYLEVIRRVRNALVHAHLSPDPEAYTQLLELAFKRPEDEEFVDTLVLLLAGASKEKQK